jgi:hypothetical protein
MDDVLTAQFGFEALTVPETTLDLPLYPLQQTSPLRLAYPLRSISRSAALIWLGLAYVAVALLLRGFTFGDPALHIDEQFYLLVGDRMLHGALPYVDIWDRKPVGLFVLYAAIRALGGGDGIVQYQVAAMISAAATALTVNRIARTIAPAAGAWWAGVAYLLYLSGFNCFGGQSPVFYNLVVALAAWRMCRIVTTPTSPSLIAQGVGVMTLIGLAMQIKYSVLFEGIAFGLALLGRAQADGASPQRLATAALAWSAAALAPTALALGVYIWIGHGQAFFFANFQSFFSRQEPLLPGFGRLVIETAALIPLWLAIFLAPRQHLRSVRAGLAEASEPGTNPAALFFLRYWAIAAVAGFLVLGVWFDHYVAPLLVPLAVLAAPMLGRPGRLRFHTWLVIGFGVVGAACMTFRETADHGSQAQIMRISDLIRANLGDGCAYINQGEPILYLTTHSCLVTRYSFPSHLAGVVDTHSLGVNVTQEVARIMANHPRVVLIRTKPATNATNGPARQILLAALARDYTRYAVATAGVHEYAIFRLRPEFATGTTVVAAR